MLAARVLL